MPRLIRIFVTYAHEDRRYLADDSLLGFLAPLAKDRQAEFWDDRKIVTGEQWDVVIKRQLGIADIAVVLVSQAFLDSDYCENVEIRTLLARDVVLFPIILSACEWQRHEWLRRRQFFPEGERTIEEHYTGGAGKRALLRIRDHLEEQIRRLGRAAASSPDPTPG